MGVTIPGQIGGDSTRCAYWDGEGGARTALGANDAVPQQPEDGSMIPCYLWQGAISLRPHAAPKFPGFGMTGVLFILAYCWVLFMNCAACFCPDVVHMVLPPAMAQRFLASFSPQWDHLPQ